MARTSVSTAAASHGRANLRPHSSSFRPMRTESSRLLILPLKTPLSWRTSSTPISSRRPLAGALSAFLPRLGPRRGPHPRPLLRRAAAVLLLLGGRLRPRGATPRLLASPWARPPSAVTPPVLTPPHWRASLPLHRQRCWSPPFLGTPSSPRSGSHSTPPIRRLHTRKTCAPRAWLPSSALLALPGPLLPGTSTLLRGLSLHTLMPVRKRGWLLLCGRLLSCLRLRRLSASPLAPANMATATGGLLPAPMVPEAGPPPTTTTLALKRTPGPLAALTQDAAGGVGARAAADLVATAVAATAQGATPPTNLAP